MPAPKPFLLQLPSSWGLRRGCRVLIFLTGVLTFKGKSPFREEELEVVSESFLTVLWVLGLCLLPASSTSVPIYAVAESQSPVKEWMTRTSFIHESNLQDQSLNPLISFLFLFHLSCSGTYYLNVTFSSRLTMTQIIVLTLCWLSRFLPIWFSEQFVQRMPLRFALPFKELTDNLDADGLWCQFPQKKERVSQIQNDHWQQEVGVALLSSVCATFCSRSPRGDS